MTKQAKQVVEVSAGGDIIITNPTHGAEVYASAPELLEVLEEAFTFIKSQSLNGDFRLLDKIADTIAKAKGDV